MESAVKDMENEGVFYEGALNQDRLAETYRNSDVFVYLTRNDTYGSVIVEALSFGCYVIVSDILRGIFDKYKQRGWLQYCPVDSEAFAASINASLEKTMTQLEKKECHDAVKADHDPDVLFGKLANFIIEAL